MDFFERLPAFIAAHPILALGFIGVSAALIATEVAHLGRKYRGVGPAQLTELINRENALVVDLRTAADFEAGHIAGSQHLPMSQVDPEHKLLAKARERPLVLVCQRGLHAGGVAQRLAKAGFQKVYLLDGGIAAWQQADLPLVQGRG